MENAPKNRDRERMDAVLDWGAEGWRLAHLLRHRLSVDGEPCGCTLPEGHAQDHECSCGSWWVDSIRRDKENDS